MCNPIQMSSARQNALTTSILAEIIPVFTASQQACGAVVYGQQPQEITWILRKMVADLPGANREIHQDSVPVLPVYVRMRTILADDNVLSIMLCCMAETVKDAYCDAGMETLLEPPSWEKIMKVPNSEFIRYLRYVQREGRCRLVLVLDGITEMLPLISEGRLSGGVMKFFKSLIDMGICSYLLGGDAQVQNMLSHYANEMAICCEVMNIDLHR